MSLLFTQVHCLHNNHVLLMKRNKEPNLGLWVAPGGKIESNEAPYESAIRELREETGLAVHEIHLRGIVSIVMPTLEQPCLQFLYAVLDFSGELIADEREGTLQWWPVSDIGQLPMPPANEVFLPHAIDINQPFYQAKYMYDANWQLVGVLEHTLRVS
jgi:8-oxo-dGTP diphosphatase